jgi:hypothetical protein
VSEKVGRNAPCPCGSGRKYKKCHGAVSVNRAVPATPSLKPRRGGGAVSWRAVPESVRRQLTDHWRAEKTREASYGRGKPMITTEHNDWRFVAVGNELHYSPAPKTKFFTDFLGNYLGGLLKTQLGDEELKKPFDERHQIAKWYDALCRNQRLMAKEQNGAYYTDQPWGAMKCWYQLAYDLYLIKHNATLQAKVIERLTHKDQFQGARFELCAAASMVVAGFNINYEDESDTTRKHAEFIATRNSLSIAVEAKSRHRQGVLGFGRTGDTPIEKINAEGLIRDALSKQPDAPYIVFIDVNMPGMSQEELSEARWLDELSRTVRTLEAEWEPGTFPANVVIFYNDPHHYSPDEFMPQFPNWCFGVPIEKPRRTLDAQIGASVAQAMLQRTNIPTHFSK